MNHVHREIPDDVVAKLPQPLHKPLRNPIRRRLLRILDASPTKLSPSEIAGTASGLCSPRCVSYHMLVLSHCGLIESEGLEAVAGNFKHYYSAKVAADGPVAEALRSTEQFDEGKGSD